MDILSNYQSLLESIGMIVNPEGTVHTQTDDGVVPTTINGLQLILPLPDQLRDPDWETSVAFHPLSEQINAGESLVQRTLCLWINARLTTTLRVLAQEIALLAADTERHRHLTIRQSKILRDIPTLDEKTVKKLINIFKRATLDGEYRLINLYQARGKELNGTLYPRVTFIEFPILTRLTAVANGDTDEVDVFGVNSLSKNDLSSLIGLFTLITGAPANYSFGSNQSNAPFFHSALGAYANLATHFNGLIDLLDGAIDDIGELHIGLDWKPGLLDELSAFIGKIPPLEHNRGDRKAPPAAQRHSLMGQVAQTNLRSNAPPVAAPEPMRNAPATRTQVVEIEDEEVVDASNAPVVKTSNWGTTLKKLRTPVTAVTRPEVERGQQRGASGRFLGYDRFNNPIYEPVVEAPRIVGHLANGEPIYDRPLNGAPVQQNNQPRFAGNSQYVDPRYQQQQPYYNQQPYNNGQPQPQRMSRRQMENSRRY